MSKTTQKPLHVEVTEKSGRRLQPGSPTQDKFKFKPLLFPRLDDKVVSLSWETTEKLLQLSIDEDGELTCYRWLTYLDQKAHELEKSPFVNLEANGANLLLYDANDNEVAEFRFKNLGLKHHTVHFNNRNFSVASTLQHQLTLSYQYVDMLRVCDKYPPTPSEKIVDEEWLIESA